MKKYPLIQLPGLKTIEAEKGEVLVNPEGITFAIDGKTHAKGGTSMLAEQGSIILSKHLKLPKEVVSSLDMGKKAMSPADLSKKVRTDKYKEILESTDDRYDDLAKQTAALMLEKNKSTQALIFEAQERLKKSKGMKNAIDSFQSGGLVNSIVSSLKLAKEKPQLLIDDVVEARNRFSNAPNFSVLDFFSGTSQGYSTREDGLLTTYNRPFATDSYFTIQKDLLGSKGYNAEQMKILGERQARLSSIKQTFGDKDGAVIEREFAKYMREADKQEKDQFLDKFVVLSDGSKVEMVNATDEQIEKAQSFLYYNKRTGRNDIVDLRDRQNQGFDPILKYQAIPRDIDVLQPLPAKDIPISKVPSKITNIPAPVVNQQAPPEVKVPGMDMQKVVNGVQMGLLALDLATVRTKPPYYDYRPTELAYTRYEPINTKQQERAFNIARESIENSNLPTQVKNAQLANMYGSLVEGINQVDLANQQGKIANDNSNISRFFQVRQQDNLREQDANMRFVQEADRRNAQAAMQRQVYLSNIMDVWNKQVANRRDVRLVNQLSPNFDYNFNREQIQFDPNSRPPITGGNLDAFKTNSQGIDPRLLNAEGRKLYGYE